MFTSRAEFRLTIRADNADQRMTPLGVAAGCVRDARKAAFDRKMVAISTGVRALKDLSFLPAECEDLGIKVSRDGQRRSAFSLLGLANVTPTELRAKCSSWPDLAPEIEEQIHSEAIYAPYLPRQQADVDALRRDEAVPLDHDLNYAAIAGLSAELRLKLSAVRPRNIAQAARIEGMTPAALLLLAAHASLDGRRMRG